MICRIPEEVVRSWADSFEKVMSSDGMMNVSSMQNVYTVDLPAAHVVYSAPSSLFFQESF